MPSQTLHDKSALAIPAYAILSVLPHAYALYLASGGKPGRWDNRNPRAAGLKKKLQDTLPPTVFLQYERCEAASANLYENAPLFYAAIVVGKTAALPDLHGFAGTYLALRTLYVVVYATTTSQRWSYLRSVLWFGSSGLCIRTLVRAAKALGAER